MDIAPRIVATADGRRVGYRRFGEGPPVALLHASPRSSAALVPLGRMLAHRFTVFAFDNPGFGSSDPLPIARPDAEDFGDALIAAFDAIGILRAPVYGSHTGAAIAVGAGLRHPDRVSGLVLDGYAMFTPTEQAEYLATYLVSITPKWDGSHLAFLWSRVKDQFTVFPWYLRGQAGRIARDLVPLATMQGVVNDFLAAGDGYIPGYASAFRFDGGPKLCALIAPTVVMARSDDLLFGHLDLLPDLPDHIAIQRLPAENAAWSEAIGDALARGASGPPPEVPAPRLADGWHEIVRVPGGAIAVRCFGQATSDKTIVLLSGIPGSARGEAGLARAIGDGRRVLGVDLPGFGASSLTGEPDADAIAAAIRAALASLGVAGFDVVALGESGAIGCALGGRATVLVDPVPDTARDGLMTHMADLTPRSDGSHLLAAWHQLRDSCLWRPWHTRLHATALEIGPDPDVGRLHAIFADWLLGGTEGRRTLTAALSIPVPGGAVAIEGLGPDPRSRAQAILGALDRQC